MAFLKNMKLTISLPNQLLKSAMEFASSNNLLFNELIEAALVAFLKGNSGPRTKFRLRSVTYGTGGLVEGLSENDWGEIRKISSSEAAKLG